ncbi:MAG: hypothetical protein GY796_36485 [Chloroflexi bacterium]|nr:hypothetical protein [Chloroflexota bacterium]
MIHQNQTNDNRINKIILKTIPYLMPPGSAIVLSMTIYLSMSVDWPWLAAPVAIILASIFELGGYLVAHNFAAQVESGNGIKAAIAGLFMVGFVAAAVAVVVVGHEAIGNLLLVAILAAFPVVSIMVYLSQAMMLQSDESAIKKAVDAEALAKREEEERAALAQREADEWNLKMDIKRQREEARVDRDYGRPTNRPTVQPTVQPNVQNGRPTPSNTGNLDEINAQRLDTLDDRLDAVLDFLDVNPYATLSQIGDHLGLSKSSGGNYVDRLIVTGRLTKNGNGFERVTK